MNLFQIALAKFTVVMDLENFVKESNVMMEMSWMVMGATQIAL